MELLRLRVRVSGLVNAEYGVCQGNRSLRPIPQLSQLGSVFCVLALLRRLPAIPKAGALGRCGSLHKAAEQVFFRPLL